MTKDIPVVDIVEVNEEGHYALVAFLRTICYSWVNVHDAAHWLIDNMDGDMSLESAKVRVPGHLVRGKTPRVFAFTPSMLRKLEVLPDKHTKGISETYVYL